MSLLKIVFKTPDNGNYFFGYYDKSPLNKSNTKLLACRSTFINRLPNESDTLEIGYFDWKTNHTFQVITKTNAWNWQQGCMLQWHGPDFEKKIIFNDLRDNKFVTVIFDIETRKEEILPMAYYTANVAGTELFCIDNERHSFYRENYSYKGIYNKTKKQPLLLEDGIWKINVQKGIVNQIITLKDLVNHKRLSSMNNATHYVEHLMISPLGDRLLFMHRWRMIDGGIYSRLYTSNTDGSDLFLLNDSGRMSHYSWMNNEEVIGWGGISNPFNSIRRSKLFLKNFIKPVLPIYKKYIKGNSVQGNSTITKLITGDSYILFKDKTNIKKRLTNKLLVRDGHPSCSPKNSNLMVTDTYPLMDLGSKQMLILSDLKKNESKVIDLLNHNEDFNNTAHRCDLHPKFSLDGKFVSIDTINEGCRSIYIYEL